MPPSAVEQIRHGSPEFRRTTLAMFAAGFATFALLYCVQPLLPVFSRDFGVSAATSSLSLSLTTGLLAPAMIVVGVISEARGRKSLMVASLGASATITIASAFVRDWTTFLVLRGLAGLAFAGLPALSMAYLAEEVHPTSIGFAMGLSIGGNGLGGMLGRLLTAFITDLSSWRAATVTIGALGLVATWISWKWLPPSRNFVPRPARLGALLTSFATQLRSRTLIPLYIEGFILLGALVTTYNYVTYKLLAPPYSLSQSAAGLIFAVYLVGIFASAWIGALADRAGRERMLVLMLVVMLVGVALTLASPLAVVVLGVAVITFGFFGGHSIASSWIGLRATHAKGQASALYLFFYYIGSSIAGSIGGLFWGRWRWDGVAAFTGGLVAVGLAAAVANVLADRSATAPAGASAR